MPWDAVKAGEARDVRGAGPVELQGALLGLRFLGLEGGRHGAWGEV